MDLLSPVFVIGSPRSGTSLLRLILTSHSEVVIPPECGFIVWLHETYKNWPKGGAADAGLLSRYLDDLFACKKIDTWGVARDFVKEILVKQEPENYASLNAIIVLAYALKHGKTPLIWGDKNNFHTSCLPVLNALYPQARFLHIVRDGRDVACSYREVMGGKSSSPYAPHLAQDVGEIAVEWSDNVLRVDSYLAGMDAGRRHLIRYEDLVQSPETSVTDICRWIGIRYESEMLNAHVSNRKFKLEPSLTLDWKQRTLEPISTSTVGRFSKILSAKDRAHFARLAGSALTKFGYNLEN